MRRNFKARAIDVPKSNAQAVALQARVQYKEQMDQTRRQKALTMIKTDLAVSDADFSVLEPRIAKCMETRSFALLSTVFKDFGPVHPLTPAFPNHPYQPARTPASQATQDLDLMLQDKETSAAAIQAQEQVIRQYRQQADDDHAAACKELRDLVTHRQEVVLFFDNVLD